MSSEFHSDFIDNGATKILGLLHGTGGDENDLLPIVKNLAKEYNFLGIRGNVTQQGMTRFFLRNGDGSFDIENIKEEVEKLKKFLADHPADAFVGYSNGANMILALALLHPDFVKQAVILHGKLPFEPQALSLDGKAFLISYGENDQIISKDESLHAVAKLQSLGATVQSVSHTGGHEIHKNEITAMEKFLTY